MRYYSTQRPLGPGTYPKPQGNAVKEAVNFRQQDLLRGSWPRGLGLYQVRAAHRPAERNGLRAYCRRR